MRGIPPACFSLQTDDLSVIVDVDAHVYVRPLLLWRWLLYELDAGFGASGTHVIRPDAGLDLTDMCLLKEQHAEA